MPNITALEEALIFRDIQPRNNRSQTNISKDERFISSVTPTQLRDIIIESSISYSQPVLSDNGVSLKVGLGELSFFPQTDSKKAWNDKTPVDALVIKYVPKNDFYVSNDRLAILNQTTLQGAFSTVEDKVVYKGALSLEFGVTKQNIMVRIIKIVDEGALGLCKLLIRNLS